MHPTERPKNVRLPPPLLQARHPTRVRLRVVVLQRLRRRLGLRPLLLPGLPLLRVVQRVGHGGEPAALELLGAVALVRGHAVHLLLGAHAQPREEVALVQKVVGARCRSALRVRHLKVAHVLVRGQFAQGPRGGARRFFGVGLSLGRGGPPGHGAGLHRKVTWGALATEAEKRWRRGGLSRRLPVDYLGHLGSFARGDGTKGRIEVKRRGEQPLVTLRLPPAVGHGCAALRHGE